MRGILIIVCSASACGGTAELHDAAPADVAPAPDSFTSYPPSCVAHSVAPGTYGSCPDELGYGVVLDQGCMPVTGCDCAPDCAQLFATEEECALASVAEGCCFDWRFFPDGNAVHEGTICPLYAVCGAEPTIDVPALMPGAICDDSMPKICSGMGGCHYWVEADDYRLSAQEYQAMCAASLVSSVYFIGCIAGK